MDAAKRAALQRVIDSGYVHTIQELAKGITAPFWWHEDFDEHDLAENPRPIIKANGTITFVDTGEKILGVTNDHVYQGYLSSLENDSSLICQIGAASFRPEERIIDRSPPKTGLDLATFDLSDVLVNASMSRIHRSRGWPPPDAQVDDLVVLGGWPGTFRDERLGALNAYFASFITRIDSSIPEHSRTSVNVTEAIPSGKLILPDDPDLGGSSGGPILRIREETTVTLELVGFIYEYSQAWQVVLARHANRVSADGTIRG